MNNLNPTWQNEKFTLEVNERDVARRDAPVDPLRLEVYDWDGVGAVGKWWAVRHAL